MSGEKGRTVEDEIEPGLGADKGSEPSSKPCETDSGTVNPNFNEEMCDRPTDCALPTQVEDQLQSPVVSLVNSKDDQILLPEVVETLIPEDSEKTEK